MDIIQQLRGSHWADASERLRLVNLAADEIERLRQQNAELLEGLKRLDRVAQDSYGSPAYGGMASSFVQSIVKQTIAKATGGE